MLPNTCALPRFTNPASARCSTSGSRPWKSKGSQYRIDLDGENEGRQLFVCVSEKALPWPVVLSPSVSSYSVRTVFFWPVASTCAENSVSAHFPSRFSSKVTKPFKYLSHAQKQKNLQRTQSSTPSPHSSTDRHQIHAFSLLRPSPAPIHSARPSPSFEHIQSMIPRASPSVRRLRRALL